MLAISISKLQPLIPSQRFSKNLCDFPPDKKLLIQKKRKTWGFVLLGQFRKSFEAMFEE